MQLKHRPIFCLSFFKLYAAINLKRGCFNQITTILIVKITAFMLCILLAGTGSLLAQHQLSQSKAERLFQKGTELVAHANYGAARKVFSDFLEEASTTDPRRGEAEYYVAFS